MKIITPMCIESMLKQQLVVVEQFNTSIWAIRVGEVRSVMSSLSISITSIITSAGATNAKIVPFSTDIQQLQKRSNQQKCY